jgi:YVTN family beta-propeller protein
MKRLLPGVAGLLIATSIHAQAPEVSLWVTLGDSDQLVEMDPWTFTEIRRIKVDPRPHGLAIAPDGSKLYVTSDKTGNLQVIDARTGQITGTLPLGNDPNQLTLTRDGKFAYVPMRGESKIAVVELDPLRLVKKLPVPGGPHDGYTSADGSRIYFGAQYGSAVIVIDPATRSVLYTIPVAAGARPLEPSADGKTIYVALSKLLGFVVVDPVARKVTRRVELGTLPEGLPVPEKDTWTHGLQVANGGKELWLCDDINDLVRVVRLSDMKEVATIRVGHFPHWFAMRPDNKVVFVSLWFSDAVAAIDVQTRKVVSNMQFARSGGPKRIAIGRRVR